MRRGQRGSATIELTLGFALVLVPTLGLLAAVAWPERLNAANAAAYEAAKAVVTADDADTGMELGRQRAAETLANHGYPDAVVGVAYAGTLVRGGAVTATVTVRLPAVTFLGLGRWAAVDAARSRTLRVPDHRGLG